MQRLLKYAYILVLLNTAAYGQYSNKIQFRNISVQDGLSFPAVNCMLQDKNGFLWIGTDIGLNRYDSQNFRSYSANKKDSLSLADNSITALYENEPGEIWIGTASGISIYNPATSAFRRIDQPRLQSKVLSIVSGEHSATWVLLRNQLVKVGKNYRVERSYPIGELQNREGIHAFSSAFKDRKGNLWVYTDKGLRLFDPISGKLLNVLEDTENFVQSTVDFFSVICEDSRGNLWVGVRGAGVKFYDSSQKRWVRLDGVSSQYINGIYEDINKNIWIVTGRNGLNIYYPETGKIEVIKYAEVPESNLLSNSLSCIYGDKMGGIWIGTFNNGLLYYYQHQFNYNLYYSKGQIKGISSNYLTAFATERSGNTWIGVGEEGLLRFDRNKNEFVKINPDPRLFSSSSELKENFYILSLHLTPDEKRLFIGTLTGLFEYRIETQTWKFYSRQKSGDQRVSLTYVTSILQDGDQLYLSGNNRFTVFDLTTGEYKKTELENGYISCMAQSETKVYLGVRQSKLWEYDKAEKTIRKIETPLNLPGRIRCILVDKKGRVVVGSDNGGLFRFNAGFTEAEQIGNSYRGKKIVFQSLCNDPLTGYWAATTSGLIRVSEDFRIADVYGQNDGFTPNYFTPNGLFLDQNKEILVGGNAGFYSFIPAKFRPPARHYDKVQILDILVMNKSIPESEAEGFKITGDRGQIRRIALPKYQNLVTFEYSTVDFHNPSRGEYAFRLLPYDKEWNNVGSRHYATYRDLPAGTYTFQVKYRLQPDHSFNEITEMELYIPYIWWQSPLALLAYLLFVILLVREFYLYRVNKRRLSQEIEMQRFRNEKMQELHNFKIDFFTQVTHELRTPLTLIISPLEEIIQRYNHRPEKNLLKIIHRNTQKLLRTVNQILDFRKIENKDMKVFAKKGDIVTFAEEVLYSFLNLTEAKGVRLIFDTNMEKYPYVLFDKDIMEKILVNLISNANKFTSQGSITLRVYENENERFPSHYSIQVSDTGRGIRPENLRLVFDPFFQEHRDFKAMGSGVGLKIVKELVSLHKGTLELESEYEKGTTITLHFPKADLDLVNEEPLRPNLSKESTTEVTRPSAGDLTAGTSKILVVDDETDVLLFLEEIFAGDFHVYSADSAKKAIDIARTELPDIIVSDVMMPEMDGLEFCKFLKTDFLLGHIPVVLLTALNSTEHEIEGLKTGADAYVSKPFSVNLLRATVQNLLVSRQKLKQAFLNSSISNAREFTQNNTDKEFIERVIELIDEKLDKTDLELNDISNELGMSQSTFYRKLKSLTDLSGNEFIRAIRLKRSVDLLKNSTLNISEIAYKVGFSDPKYFSTCFRKFFHTTPTEFMLQNRKDTFNARLN